MNDDTAFDYYYGDESEQFAFYRIPRQLITGERFRKLSTDAKLLYGLLLDRMGLSVKNGWYDEQSRVYIYYTLSEIQQDMSCGHEKAVKLLAELDTGHKGIGLIERIRQGQGRPTRIYVKRFSTRAIPPKPVAPEAFPRLPILGSQDFGKSEVKSSEKPKCRLPVFGNADFGNPDASYIKYNKTDFSQLDPSIYPSPSPPQRLMDGYDCKTEIKERIEYCALCSRYNCEDVDEIVELITDTICTTRTSIRIGGDDISAEQVRARFLCLDCSHIEYVFDCLRQNATKIRNIRAYLLTTLYNAPATINHYYQAEVQHDFPGI
jgi:hypothetical protein